MTPSATEIHYKKFFSCLGGEKVPKNPPKDLKCSSKPTRRVSASTPATPSAHAVQKIINTIKCSLKSLIKCSHSEAGQWGNRMQPATLSRSPESSPGRVTLNAHSRTQREQPCPLQSSPELLSRAAPPGARELHRAHQGSYWGRSKPFLAPPPR